MADEKEDLISRMGWFPVHITDRSVEWIGIMMQDDKPDHLLSPGWEWRHGVVSIDLLAPLAVEQK